MSHYTGGPKNLVEDLINSHDLFLDEPEHLKTPDDLDTFLANHGFKLDTAVIGKDLEAVRKLRDQLRDIWTAETQNRAISRLNVLLSGTPVVVQFAEESLAITLQAMAPVALVEQVAVQCSAGIVSIIHTHGFERMRSCDASPCRDVFVDVSRNKSRRFCSDRCSNRFNIAAYRERHRDSESES